MEIKDLKKDKIKSIRINSDILRLIEEKGLTIQQFLDLKLEKEFTISVKDLNKSKK